MNSFYGQNHHIDLREHTQIESQVCQLRATALARAFNEIDSFHTITVITACLCLTSHLCYCVNNI